MDKKKIYIVSGASGHLGNTVVRKLLQKGESVRCLIMEAEGFLDQPFYSGARH